MKAFGKSVWNRIVLIFIDIMVVIGDLIEFVFKMVWYGRYAYIKGLTAIINRAKIERTDLDHWGSRLTEMAKTDITDSAKIHELRKKSMKEES